MVLEQVKEDKDTSMIIYSCVNAEKMYWKCRTSKLSLDLIIGLWALEGTPEEREQMFWHLYLHYFVSTTMNRHEFHRALGRSRVKVDYYSKYRLWQHNKRCLLFFMRFYDEFVKDVKAFPKHARNYDKAQKLLAEIHYQIGKLQEIRTFFPYCAECQFHLKEHCQFWNQVGVDTSAIRTRHDPNHELLRLWKYFAKLKIECHCPRSLAELDQFKDRGNF